MYDIAIVGGGPAGATLARLIGRKHKVLLLERRTFGIDASPTDVHVPSSDSGVSQSDIHIPSSDSGVSLSDAYVSPIDTCMSQSGSGVSPSGSGASLANEKCCGGLIAPDAQQMLARFRLGIPGSVLRSPQLFAVRAIDMQNSIERYYQRYYINIDRYEFDKWLLSLIPSQVGISYGCVFRSFEENEGHVTVRYSRNGEDHRAEAKLLVGADGAYSSVRRRGFSDKPAPELYTAIQEWFAAEDCQNCYGAIFDDEITDYYSWTIPKGNTLILGAALKADSNVKQKFELLKQKLNKYGYDFENRKGIRRSGVYVYRPVKSNQICTGSDRIALVGEAAGFISPSSAEGLSYAFRSALALARALDSGIDRCGERYDINLGSLMRNISIKNLKSVAMYNRFARKFIMKTGLNSISIADD